MSMRLAVPDWEVLPEELLCLISQIISPITADGKWQNMHLVCKSWNRTLLASPERYSAVHLLYADIPCPGIASSSESVAKAHRTLHRLTLHGAHVRKLVLCFYTVAGDPVYSAFHMLWHKLPALTTLIIKAMAIDFNEPDAVEPELPDESSAAMTFNWLSTLHLATSLTSLDIRLPSSQQGATGRHALQCLAPLTGLRSLKLTCGTFYQPGLMAALANLTSLSELSLTGTALADESLATDAALPAHLPSSLQALTYVVSNGLLSPTADLASFSQLTQLKLQVTPWHFHTRTLQSVFPHLTDLLDLSLIYGITRNARAEHIHALSLLTRLTSLDFFASHVHMVDEEVPEEDEEALDCGIPLAAALPHLTSLHYLYLKLPCFTVTELSALTQLTHIALHADVLSHPGQLLSPSVQCLDLHLSAQSPLPHCALGCASLTHFFLAADSDACFSHPHDLPATLLPRMSHADLLECRNLTVLPRFLAYAPALTHLHIAWSSKNAQLLNSLPSCIHELSALRVVDVYVDEDLEKPDLEELDLEELDLEELDRGELDLDLQPLVAVARAMPPRVWLVLDSEVEAHLLAQVPDLPDNIKFVASASSPERSERKLLLEGLI